MGCNRDRYDESPEADELRRQIVEPRQNKPDMVIDANLHIKEMKDYIYCMKRLQDAKAEVARLRSENAQLQGQQSAVRDFAASEVDDLIEEIAAKDKRIADLEETLDFATALYPQTIREKEDRIAELEAAIRLIVGTYDRFEASSIEDADVSTMLALTGTVRAIGRAEAILGTGSQAAPKEGEDDLMTCPNCEEGMDKVCSDGWRCPECGEECRVIPCRRQDDGAGQR